MLAVALVGALFTLSSPPASAGTVPPCDPGETLLRGQLRDEATGLPIQGAEINVHDDLGNGFDQVVTGANGRYQACYVDDTYHLLFTHDSYRSEWFDNSADFASSSAVVLAGGEPVGASASLVPKGRVLAGRVTNLGGVAKFASISIWRRTPSGWRAYDNIGNDLPSGKWSFRVPGVGRYRVNACVDHHWCRWAESETRLRFARNLNVTASTTYLADVDIRVPYCTTGGGAFCVPPGFLT